MLELLLPEGILEYFQVADVVKKNSEYIFVLEDVNIHLEQNQVHKLTSK